MATPAIMAKKAAKQTAEILVAIQLLTDEIAELKATKPDTIDRTDEILAAIGNAFGEIRKHQVAELAVQVDDSLSKSVQTRSPAGRTLPAEPPSTRASRKPKK